MSQTLQAQLSGIDHDGDKQASRRAALDCLAGHLDAGRQETLAGMKAGRLSSLEAARSLSACADEAIAGLYHFVTRRLMPPSTPTEAERFSVIAVGGYGRGLLAPFSDLDLLFLRSWKQTAREETIIETLLYMLWDLKLKVGHSARTIDQTILRARKDHVILTTLLDARLLAGDQGPYDDLIARLRAEAIDGRKDRFVADKLAERDARLKRAGASRFMVEPDIKDGKGGLRDLNTLSWIAQALFPGEGIAGLPVRGLLSETDAERYGAALSFLWSARIHLHDAAGRPQEVLSFDYQPELADRMGYADAKGQPAVELFMRDYFRVATDVGALVRIACAQLEAIHAKPAPRGVSREQEALAAGALDDEAFAVIDGRLGLVSPEVLTARPRLLLSMFLQADRLGLDLHPSALSAARDSLELIDEDLRRDPQAAETFFAILTETEQPALLLRLMIEAGVLGAYLPEFGRVVGSTQFNMYHAFTVDEHTLRAIATLAAIGRGEEEARHPLASQVLPAIKRRRLLFLAMLLHDTGKAGGDQCEAGAAAARKACARWGLPEDESALIEWLILHHLDMSDAAQRRDLGDPKTIQDFADLLGDKERLDMLLCLTIADIRAVGPRVWNDFKGELMRELYRLTLAALPQVGGEAAGRVEASLTARSEARKASVTAARINPAVQAWLAEMDEAYWLAFEPPALNRHAGFAAIAWTRDAPAARANPNARRGAAELLVAAPDRLGLFADLAAAMTDLGADVIDARIFTTERGQAFDIFYLQTPMGAPFGDQAPAALRELEEAALQAAQGDAPRRDARDQPPRPREAVFEIEPEVTFDDAASDRFTVIEVSARDRTGLLRDLARALASQGVSVASAHIESRGERAVDVFYVSDDDGTKLFSEQRRDEIARALLQAVGEREAEMEDASNARGLRRAPSSPAR